jgi:hypothetical protein
LLGPTTTNIEEKGTTFLWHKEIYYITYYHKRPEIPTWTLETSNFAYQKNVHKQAVITNKLKKICDRATAWPEDRWSEEYVLSALLTFETKLFQDIKALNRFAYKYYN